jgi:hypothetical protein
MVWNYEFKGDLSKFGHGYKDGNFFNIEPPPKSQKLVGQIPSLKFFAVLRLSDVVPTEIALEFGKYDGLDPKYPNSNRICVLRVRIHHSISLVRYCYHR